MLIAQLLAASLFAGDCRNGSCQSPGRLFVRVPAFAATVPLPVAPITAVQTVPIVPVQPPGYVAYLSRHWKYRAEWYYPQPLSVRVGVKVTRKIKRAKRARREVRFKSRVYLVR